MITPASAAGRRAPLAAVLVVVCAACAGPAAAPPAGPTPSGRATPSGLGRPARVERVRFHGADAVAETRARATLERRLSRSHGAPLAVDLQLVRVEVGRRLRPAALPLALLTLGAWEGDGAWRVEGRLHGRLRLRDAAGCTVVEVQERLDYARRAGRRDPTPLPDAGEVRALVDGLLVRARRRLQRATGAARDPSGAVRRTASVACWSAAPARPARSP